LVYSSFCAFTSQILAQKSATTKLNWAFCDKHMNNQTRYKREKRETVATVLGGMVLIISFSAGILLPAIYGTIFIMAEPTTLDWLAYFTVIIAGIFSGLFTVLNIWLLLMKLIVPAELINNSLSFYETRKNKNNGWFVRVLERYINWVLRREA
jgi:hypothetical protein